jgi:Lar family restriction alleviation protein
LKYLPCPFCGKDARTSVSKDESLWSHEIVDWYYVGCDSCDFSMSECIYEEDLIEKWNSRV